MIMKKPHVVSSQPVFQAKLFNVKEIKLQYPNGNIRTHYAAERQRTSIVLPLTDKYELYLVSQYRYLIGKTTLEAVAGFINKGETPLQCAKRELSEEAGIIAEQWEQLLQIESVSVFEAKEYIFLAKGLEIGKQHFDEDENIVVVKLSLEEAVQKVLYGEITTAVSIIGIMVLDRLKREKKL